MAKSASNEKKENNSVIISSIPKINIKRDNFDKLVLFLPILSLLISFFAVLLAAGVFEPTPQLEGKIVAVTFNPSSTHSASAKDTPTTCLSYTLKMHIVSLNQAFNIRNASIFFKFPMDDVQYKASIIRPNNMIMNLAGQDVQRTYVFPPNTDLLDIVRLEKDKVYSFYTYLCINEKAGISEENGRNAQMLLVLNDYNGQEISKSFNLADLNENQAYIPNEIMPSLEEYKDMESFYNLFFLLTQSITNT